MTPERWQQVKAVLDAALEREPGERAAFISKACAGDEPLRKELESLILSHEQAGSFIEEPAVESLAEIIADKGESLVNRTLGPYQVQALLGAGGMGEVYLAEDTRLGRRIALKVLPAHLSGDKDRLQRFQQEARAASSLNHPNILTIYEIGAADDRPFIATEYIEGETLRQRLTEGRVELSEALDMSRQVASALAAAHAVGIVHRDIKPENIMVRTDGFVKVLDFGLVKLTEKRATDSEASTLVNTAAGVVMGTAYYMSPEQARGLEVDARTDIWSLGVVLYEMVTGQAPFEGGTPSDVLSLILQREPAPLVRYAPEVPTELERIIRKALHKDREERYQTVKDFLIDLKNLRRELQFKAELERSAAPNRSDEAAAAMSNGQAVAGTATPAAVQTSLVAEAHPTSSAEYIVTEIKRHKKGVGLAATGILALLVIGTVSYMWFSNRHAPALTEKDTIVLADFVNTTGDAIFDGTLKQALAVQLEQSPFLNIFSDQRVRETLRFMNRSPDERVTKDVAREVCERQGLKAYISGSITNLGSHFVITLEAVNAQTGDTIARQQVEAESKEQVLSALGSATTKLREKLGESLASIRKYDAPIQEVTTSSLEALKAFSMGEELNGKVKMDEAIPFFKRAVELDPNFAIAYSALSSLYILTGQRELGNEAGQKAFDLRERVSEREKLSITANHYKWAGEMEKASEANEMLTRIYPRAWGHWNNLGYNYLESGRTEKAIEPFHEAIRLYPNAYPYWGLGLALQRLNRFDEAKEAYEQGLTHDDHLFFHSGLYSIAFVKGDAGAMQRQVDWASARPEQLHLIWQGNVAAFSGQLRRAREFYYRGIEIGQRYNKQGSNKQLAAGDTAWIAFREAVSGDCHHVKEDIAKSLAIIPDSEAKWRSAMALALCGETAQAQSLIDDIVKRDVKEKDAVWVTTWLPLARAAIEIRRNNSGRAIEQLRSAHAFIGLGLDHQAPAVILWPEYMRGVAYLNQKAGAEAAAEFQTILDHRGMVPMGIHYPLAHLGMARAAALSGDMAKARKYYQDFFALWKDADSDIPILVEAKKEYERLK